MSEIVIESIVERKPIRLSPWTVVHDYCAMRFVEGTDPNLIANRVAFIEKHDLSMKRALIVEDSSAFSKLFLLIVRHLGYATELHRGIVGARSACDGKRFDLYVVDIRIQASEAGGDGDGLEFVRWLRERHADAKVIVCSSDVDRADEARSLGCDFVAKGPDLTTRLHEAVARSTE